MIPDHTPGQVPPAWQELTPAQHKVLTLVAQGLTNEQIAADVGARTAEAAALRVRRAMRRLGASSRTHAVALLLQQRLIPPPPIQARPPAVQPKLLIPLRMAAAGLTEQQIARRLTLTTGAVDSRIRRALEQLGARNRPHGIALAWAHHLITPEDIHPVPRRNAQSPPTLGTSPYTHQLRLRILRLAAAGLTNPEIARTLHHDLNSIKYHIRNISEVLGARSRTHAVSLGWAHRLITPADLRTAQDRIDAQRPDS